MSDGDEVVDRVARAIYASIPTWQMARRPTTMVSPKYETVRVDYTWDEAADRHEECRRLARVAIEAMFPPHPPQ